MNRWFPIEEFGLPIYSIQQKDQPVQHIATKDDFFAYIAAGNQYSW